MAIYDAPTSRYGVSFYDGYTPPGENNMAKISLKLSSKSLLEILTLAKNVHTGLGSNPYVTAPLPTLAVLQTKITAAESAFDAYEAGKDTLHALKLARDAAFVALEGDLRTEAVTVMTATGGNAMQIATTGFEIAATPVQTTTPPGEVGNLRVSSGPHDGTLTAKWDRAADVQLTEVQASIDPPTPSTWVMKGSTPKSRITVN